MLLPRNHSIIAMATRAYTIENDLSRNIFHLVLSQSWSVPPAAGLHSIPFTLKSFLSISGTKSATRSASRRQYYVNSISRNWPSCTGTIKSDLSVSWAQAVYRRPQLLDAGLSAKIKMVSYSSLLLSKLFSSSYLQLYTGDLGSKYQKAFYFLDWDLYTWS